ncbi:interference hedgehog isoform X2 [Chelonus insularis]|uniref:interference hedgehog isoform X2 n=1 Tax=Chelonus insularis TaxID=460826 RepID=UPI0015891042|nr:interference hedgehog isoform X2 [Chelonus insularis]
MRQLIFNLFGILIFFLLSLGIQVKGSQKEWWMSFTQHPRPLPAPLGDEVIFECSVNLPSEKFIWYHRPFNSEQWKPLLNVPVPYNEKEKSTSKFVLNFDDESKAGDYRCVAFFGTSGVASDPGRLSLAKMDRFTDKSNVTIRVPAGNTVPITCPVPYSVPEAVVQFYKDNVLIKNAISTGDKTMIIKNVKTSDSGSYHCTAENYITGQIYKSNYWTVLKVNSEEKSVDPFFINKPTQKEYKVLKGRNITLECFGAGYPIPNVTWSRFAVPLPRYSQSTSAGLSIQNVEPSDQGEYHCAWTTDKAKIEALIRLNVYEAPQVIKGPKSESFLEGKELQLSCNVTGTPEPKIEWLINGEALQPNYNVKIKGSSLCITSVEKKHAGIVQCVASNDYGSHSGSNLLKVTPKQQVSGGNWSQLHEPLNNNRKQPKSGGKKKNKDGHKDGIELVPPNPPNVTRLSDVSVMVRWSVPENTGLPISFFKVQYREIKSNNRKWMTPSNEIPNHVRSFEVTDLQPNHTYRFRIAAVYTNNDNKPSNNSAKFFLTKMNDFEMNKMPIPLFIGTEALGPDRIFLTWQNPNKSIPIDGFYVYHRASTSAGDYIKTTVEGINATNVTICHLQPETTYEFKIQSFSVDAASEFSIIRIAKTLKLVTESPPVQQILPEIGSHSTRNAQNGTLYAIIGGTLGGLVLLGVLSTILVVYKRSRIKQSRETSQSEGKTMSNGLVINGGVTDSKINITSNPLAVLDTSETTIQPKKKNNKHDTPYITMPTRLLC